MFCRHTDAIANVRPKIKIVKNESNLSCVCIFFIGVHLPVVARNKAVVKVPLLRERKVAVKCQASRRPNGCRFTKSIEKITYQPGRKLRKSEKKREGREGKQNIRSRFGGRYTANYSRDNNRT